MNNLSLIDDQDNISDIKVEDKCVYYGHSLCAECVVRFVGQIESKQGVYYGIEFASPIGMNDGAVDGVKYFQCPPKHGLFVKNYRLKRIEDCPAPLGGIWSKLMKGIDVGSRVIVSNGSLEGIVITIFHWFTDERRANKPVMVGVLLDKRKGNSDGIYQGVRHFYCENLRATFVENFEVRLPTNRTTIAYGETRGLSRANSIRSINSNTSEWRNPTPYFASNRVARSPALSSRDRPGLKTQLNCRPSINHQAIRPSIASDDSDKREIVSLKNIIDELTKEHSKSESLLLTKTEDLQKQETELLALRAELEGANFELLEYKSIINSLGVGNLQEQGNSSEPLPNLFVRTSSLIALLCLNLSRANPNEKERLTKLFNSFFTVPHSTNVGSLPSTIASFENAVSLAEQILPTISDKLKTPAPSTNSDLILKVEQPPTTPLNTQSNSSVLSNFGSISKAFESLALGSESPAKMNGE